MSQTFLRAGRTDAGLTNSGLPSFPAKLGDRDDFGAYRVHDHARACSGSSAVLPRSLVPPKVRRGERSSKLVDWRTAQNLPVLGQTAREL